MMRQVAQVGGRALREMTRIAHSPYSMWRRYCAHQQPEHRRGAATLRAQLAHLRENLRGPGLREMFESANKFGEKQ